MSDLENIKALTFDVGGTVLDWHSGISAHIKATAPELAAAVDVAQFTNQWRRSQLSGMLGPQMNGETPARFLGQNIDGVSRGVLDDVLEEFTQTKVDEATRNALNTGWHQLPAWPDAAPGHARLKQKYLMSTLTILSVSLIMDVSRVAPFHWDCVISCEMLGVYKPKPEVYQRGADLLALKPSEILMVAAHSFDLMAAAGQGYRTAFINRPLEWGPDTPEPNPDSSIDLVVDGLDDLATALGCA